MFVGSTQQAAAGAMSATFTGGTARSFHLGQGYGTVPPEEKNNAPRARSKTGTAAGCACVHVCAWRGRTLKENIYHSSLDSGEQF